MPEQRVTFKATRSYYTPGVGVSTDYCSQYERRTFPFADGSFYVEKGKTYEVTIADGVAFIKEI